jgi:hypothetical protein
LNSSKEHHRERAEASFKKPAAPTTQAERAKADDEAVAQGTRDKTARLRSQRLAKEAADKQTPAKGNQRKR